jgi:hypothetical protein
MAEFENNYEQFIQKAIQAETEALNSERGKVIMSQLLEAAKKENPDLTPEEWSKIKERFMLSIFAEMLKDNEDFQKQFAHLVFEKAKEQAVSE